MLSSALSMFVGRDASIKGTSGNPSARIPSGSLLFTLLGRGSNLPGEVSWGFFRDLSTSNQVSWLRSQHIPGKRWCTQGNLLQRKQGYKGVAEHAVWRLPLLLPRSCPGRDKLQLLNECIVRMRTYCRSLTSHPPQSSPGNRNDSEIFLPTWKQGSVSLSIIPTLARIPHWKGACLLLFYFVRLPSLCTLPLLLLSEWKTVCLCYVVSRICALFRKLMKRFIGSKMFLAALSETEHRSSVFLKSDSDGNDLFSAQCWENFHVCSFLVRPGVEGVQNSLPFFFIYTLRCRFLGLFFTVFFSRFSLWFVSFHFCAFPDSVVIFDLVLLFIYLASLSFVRNEFSLWRPFVVPLNFVL